MKILLTGGAGFIGSHIIEVLQKEKVEIVVLDNLSTGSRANVPKGIPFIHMDVRDSSVLSVFEKYGFDAVIHLAGQTMVNDSIQAPRHDADINVMGTVNVLEACRKTGVKRIVFSSTAAVYGNIEQIPIAEDFPMHPMSFYGLSKWTVERYLELYNALYGLQYVVLRYANVYGERQGDSGEGGVISIFAKQIAEDLPFMIHGDGSQTRDFIYVGDVAEANWHAVCTGQVNRVFNISTNIETSLKQVVDILGRVSGKTLIEKYGPRREGDIHRSVLSNQKALQELEWQPKMGLYDGLAKTYAYFLLHSKE